MFSMRDVYYSVLNLIDGSKSNSKPVCIHPYVISSVFPNKEIMEIVMKAVSEKAKPEE